MSSNGATLRSTRYALPFNPHRCPAVTRWLRFNETSGSFTTVSDQKGGADATQVTAANQPTYTTMAGQPALSFDGSNDFINDPLVAGNTGTATRGLMFWFKPATVTGGHSFHISTAAAGASARSIEITQNGSSLFVNVAASAFVARRFTVTSALTINVAHCYSWEEDLGQSTEATKCTIWIDGVKQTGTFSDDSGAPGAQPAAMVAPSGSSAFGVSSVTAFSAPLSGTLGRNLLWLGGAGGISGGGLLTPADRAALLAFEPGA